MNGLNSAEISQIIMTIVVVCLFLWRMSYGLNNGLFAEMAGFIAVLASCIAVYYIINIYHNLITAKFGSVVPKIGYFVVAFIIYKVMTSLADAFRRVHNIPIVGNIDRFLGAIVGIAEAYLIIYFVEHITELQIIPVVMKTGKDAATVLLQVIMGSIDKIRK
ncbi:CvpA family protein [Butyrivibrio sp. YAB3001]|uniref:CvpA family protein n=1 Tax=Butyrivibrio sp. YAB3001 TaxID=1520812 RepID=UPI0008F6513B|nr:CvpA family protein [Butyrivibrio sp. YAB3001]SFB95916.1 membrane protein required for colicin V production [Butyrivibrio sp. YAB3001]